MLLGIPEIFCGKVCRIDALEHDARVREQSGKRPVVFRKEVAVSEEIFRRQFGIDAQHVFQFFGGELGKMPRCFSGLILKVRDGNERSPDTAVRGHRLCA